MLCQTAILAGSNNGSKAGSNQSIGNGLFDDSSHLDDDVTTGGTGTALSKESGFDFLDNL